MIRIKEDDLRTAIQVACGGNAVYTDKLENEIVQCILDSSDLSRDWSAEDVDAAYFLGFINSDCVKADHGSVFPILSKTKKEIERLKSLGFERPSKAVLVIRSSR